jgi:hypothetical protein
MFTHQITHIKRDLRPFAYPLHTPSSTPKYKNAHTHTQTHTHTHLMAEDGMPTTTWYLAKWDHHAQDVSADVPCQAHLTSRAWCYLIFPLCSAVVPWRFPTGSPASRGDLHSLIRAHTPNHKRRVSFHSTEEILSSYWILATATGTREGSGIAPASFLPTVSSR